MRLSHRVVPTRGRAVSGRDKATPIVRVASGNESELFTQHFTGWDADLASRNAFTDPYEAKLAKLKEEAAAAKVRDMTVSDHWGFVMPLEVL